MTEAQDLWKQIYNEFEPEAPARSPEQRAERHYSPVPEILASLARPFGTKKFLITGSVGTGKTTELLRIAESRVDDQIVVLFDVHAHFQHTVRDPHAINNLESWQLLLLLGLAVYGTATSKLGHKWDKTQTKALQNALENLEDSGSEAAVDVGKLAATLLVLVGGVGGAALGSPALGVAAGAAIGEGARAAGEAALETLNSAAAAVKWTLPLARRSHEPRSDQDGKVEAMLKAVNLLIAEVQKKYRSVLILLDGLDRITDTNNIEALFVRSNLLTRLICPMVAIAPISVRRQHMDAVRGFEAKDLVNVPVVDRAEPTYPQLGGGVQFFRDLVALRMKKLELEERPPFSPTQIGRMAWCSGGRARDFVKLVRGVAERAWDTNVSMTTDAIVEDAIDEVRRNKESGLNSDEIALLEKVLADERRSLPGGDMAIDLLDKLRLVPYPNENTWYFPHPLLTLKLLRPPS